MKDMNKTGAVVGSLLWIAGLALFIVGLNVGDNTGKWMETVGTIAFLVGLGILGALWLKRKKDE